MTRCPHCWTTQHPHTGNHMVLTRRCPAWWRKKRAGPGVQPQPERANPTP